MESFVYRYSIIIPHYNIPKLLKRCLMSIPVRRDLQIIVVDDKSSDEVILTLKEMEKVFKHVEFVFLDRNGGGGRARNIGIQHSKGYFLLFADADDFFNYCINDIMDEYKINAFDVVYFNANHVDTITYLPTKRGTTLGYALNLYNKNKNMDSFKYFFGEPWGKLVKRELIVDNNIRFDEIKIHNDTKFSYMIGYYAKKLKFDNRALYCLADRADSVSKNLSDEKEMIRLKVFCEKNKFFKENLLPYFDNLMISPFLSYIKKKDRHNFINCLKTTETYGFSNIFLFKKIIVNIILTIYSKMMSFFGYAFLFK